MKNKISSSLGIVGAQSLASDLQSHMLQDTDSLVWLTNKDLYYKTTESTNCEDPSRDFPLTDEELSYLSVSNVTRVNGWTFEFLATALVNGKKHFVVTWNEYFTHEDPEDYSTEYIIEQNSLLRYPLLYAAQKLNGKLKWSEEALSQNGYDSDRKIHQIHIFVPFDEIIGKVDGAKGYMDAVSEVIKHFTDQIK